MAARAGCTNILSLDVSTAGPDPAIPAIVQAQLTPGRATRFEIGNEVLP